MNVCCACGRHLRRKARFCSTRCKNAAASAAAGFQKAARNKHYAGIAQ